MAPRRAPQPLPERTAGRTGHQLNVATRTRRERLPAERREQHQDEGRGREEILVDALSEARPDEAPTDAVDRIAYERGHQLGADARTSRRLGRLGPERATTALVELLTTLGFEPASAGGRVVQRNCPFRHLAQRRPALVCGINRSLLQGMLDGLGASRLAAALSPADGRCCVVVTAG
jgi:predicted ArsR family transcriptional regulator